MKAILLTLLLFAPLASADLFIVGESFEQSPWAKPSKFVKVEKRAINGSDDTLYKITHSNFPDYQVLVSVSAKTNRIYSYNSSGQFESIYEAVSFASSICRGDVFLPDRAVKGGGFPLRNVPEEENKGKIFNMSIAPISKTPYFSLSIDCYDYKY